MQRLLSIAIPTFNRADRLDRQLAWLARAIIGHEDECEVIVVDNCSPDHTQQVVRRWQASFGEAAFRSFRNAENVGLCGNIARCLGFANGTYVWTVGDDDEVAEGTLATVLDLLKQHPNLGLLLLNFWGRDSRTGAIVGEQWFEVEIEEEAVDGRVALQHWLEKSIHAVIFITAAIYRTEPVQDALRRWPAGSNYWYVQVYWTAACAAWGSLLVTKQTHIECLLGASHWQKESKYHLLKQYKYVPEIFAKLPELGYPWHFCRKMILRNFQQTDFRVFLRALRRWPWLATSTATSFLLLTAVSALNRGPGREGRAQAAGFGRRVASLTRRR